MLPLHVKEECLSVLTGLFNFTLGTLYFLHGLRCWLLISTGTFHLVNNNIFLKDKGQIDFIYSCRTYADETDQFLLEILIVFSRCVLRNVPFETLKETVLEI